MWKDPMFTAVFFTNTLPSAPGNERGITEAFLRGGPVAAQLRPLLFLSHRARSVALRSSLKAVGFGFDTIAPPKRDQITRSHRGMLVRAGEENGRNISVRREWGSWVYSRAKAHSSPGTEILCPAALSSQVPGRKKAGGREGRGCSLKRKRATSAERRDSYHRSGDIPSWWVLFQHGRHPSMKHTRRVCQRRAGEPCKSDKNGTAFATMPQNVLFYREFSIKASSLEERRSCSSLKEKKSEEPWWMLHYIARCPAHSVQLCCHHWFNCGNRTKSNGRAVSVL